MTFKYSDFFVTLATVNLENLVNFYANFLGEKPSKYIPEVYGEFQLSGFKLAIFKPKASHVSEFKDSFKSSMSLCLEVDNLENTIHHLESLGHPKFGEIINASHGREIYAYDIDGNRIILHQSHK